jgi:hypothetical protein
MVSTARVAAALEISAPSATASISSVLFTDFPPRIVIKKTPPVILAVFVTRT